MNQIMKKLPGILIPRIQKQVPLVQLIQANQFSDMPIDKTYLSKHKRDKMELPEENRLPNTEYFRSVIKNFFNNDDLNVDTVKSGDSSSLQHSFMSEVKKCTLSGYDKDRRFRFDVIVKELHSKAHQELYKANIAVQNEEIVYNTILPNLNVHKAITLPVPVCYSAKDGLIILQDLCGIHQEYKMFDEKKGYIEPIECNYVLKALAKFHAASIVLKHKNKDAFKKIKNLTKELLYPDYADWLLLKHQQENLKNIVTVYKRRYPTEENVIKIAALENLIKVAKNDIEDLLSTEQDNNVFCHGNLLLTNFLYRPNERETWDEMVVDIDVKFIDFQRVLYGSIASDLVYLLFINLMPEDYITSKRYILYKYFSYLKDNIEDCGVPVDPELNFKWLQNEVDRFTEYGIINALWVLPRFSGIGIQDRKEVTKEIVDENLKYIVFNQRMERWVDYYTKIFEKRSEE